MLVVAPHKLNFAKTKINTTRLTKLTNLTCAVFPGWRII